MTRKEAGARFHEPSRRPRGRSTIPFVLIFSIETILYLRNS